MGAKTQGLGKQQAWNRGAQKNRQRLTLQNFIGVAKFYNPSEISYEMLMDLRTSGLAQLCKNNIGKSNKSRKMK